jgi:two-component system phosphate regulon sensor histidine kinase PhoR
MPPQPSSGGALLRAILVPLIALAVVLGGFVYFHRLDGSVAALAFLLLAVAMAFAMRPVVAGLLTIMRYLDGVALDQELPQPRPRRPRLVVELASALGRATRHWRQRQEETAARVAALDALLDGLPDPLITLDARLRIARANAAAGALLGEGLTGRDLATLIRVPALLEAAQAALRDRRGTRVEFELGAPVKRSFSARVERLAGRSGDDAAVILVLHDLTASKRTEQMRADFVANASHELRTPLATLIGFIETLSGPANQDREARERFLAIMQQQAGRMARLVDDLLSLSRIELHEHSAPIEPLEIEGLLRGVADALHPQSRARGMTIEIEPVEGELPPVIGDADELAQVFQNLIDNALKYGREGTAVRIAAHRADRVPTVIARMPAGGLVAVSIADESEGIPAEQIPRLTERFYRVDAARSRELGGTGLGLAIVKHIVNRHRGALEIESEMGQGSVFTVYLPAAPASAGLNAQAARRLEAAGPEGHGTVTQTS